MLAPVCLPCHLCPIYEDLLPSSRRHCAWGGAPAVHEEWRGSPWAHGTWHPWWVRCAAPRWAHGSQGQLPSGDSGVSKKTLLTCAFFINFLGYTVSLLTNVLSQNGYLLEATCGCCVGEISVGWGLTQSAWKRVLKIWSKPSLLVWLVSSVRILPLF